MPANAFRNTVWSGSKAQGVVYDQQNKTWAWPASGLVNIPASQSGLNGAIGCDVRASRVTVSGMTVNSGFRSYNFRGVSNVVLDHCTSRNAGVAGSAHGQGGHGFYGDGLTGFTMRGCIVRNPAGHGLYVAETARNVRLHNLDFSSVNEHSQLLQFNSESGQGIFDVEIHDSIFHVLDQSTGTANFLGSGEAARPVLVHNCKFQGGRQQSVAVDVAPGTRRASWVTFIDTVVEKAVFIGAGCLLRLQGSSRIGGHTGPGRLVQG